MILSIAEVRAALGLGDSITSSQEAWCELAIAEAQSAVENVLHYNPEYGQRTEILPITGSDETLSAAEFWISDGQRAFRSQYTSQGINVLQLRYIPLRSVYRLYEDFNARHGTNSGAFGSGTRLTQGVDFEPEYESVDSSNQFVGRSGLIRRVAGSWPTIPGTVKVIYYAGYQPAELNGTDAVLNARPIKDAALLLAIKAFRRFVILGKQSLGTDFAAGPKQSERMGDYQYSIATTAGVVEQASMGIDVPAEALMKLQRFINFGETFQ